MKNGIKIKNTKLNKVIFFIIILIVIVTISTVSFANFPKITSTNTVTSDKLKTIGGMIFGIVKVIAVGIAVTMLAVLAIKYMTAAPGEKADIKKSLSLYVIGALLLFGGVGFLTVIQSLGNSVNNAAGGTTSSPTVTVPSLPNPMTTT